MQPAKARVAIAMLALVVACAAVSPDEVQEHRNRMNEAQDIKYGVLDAFAANDVAAVAEAAAPLLPLLDAEADYWARTGLTDIHGLALRNRELAHAVVTTSKQGDLAATANAWASLESSCSGCHDLHPEQRVHAIGTRTP